MCTQIHDAYGAFAAECECAKPSHCTEQCNAMQCNIMCIARIHKHFLIGPLGFSTYNAQCSRCADTCVQQSLNASAGCCSVLNYIMYTHKPIHTNIHTQARTLERRTLTAIHVLWWLANVCLRFSLSIYISVSVRVCMHLYLCTE